MPDKRVIARVSTIILVSLAVVLAVRFKSRSRFPSSPRPGYGLPQGQRNPGSQPAPPPAQTRTNLAAQPPGGFYIGKGEQRVYVNYATPDPVLRSFIQSVMNGSSDPNAKGREIFLKLCAVCHQPDGEGKDGVAPPLAGSEWALTPQGGRLVRIVLNGVTGPMHVRGRDWNLAMPPWRENLTDDQVAVVLTYVRSRVGTNHAGAITPEFVAAARKEAHPPPETPAELLRIPDQ
jgi:mono/diheme cytochrome c family protein